MLIFSVLKMMVIMHKVCGSHLSAGSNGWTIFRPPRPQVSHSSQPRKNQCHQLNIKSRPISSTSCLASSPGSNSWTNHWPPLAGGVSTSCLASSPGSNSWTNHRPPLAGGVSTESLEEDALGLHSGWYGLRKKQRFYLFLFSYYFTVYYRLVHIL